MFHVSLHFCAERVMAVQIVSIEFLGHNLKSLHCGQICDFWHSKKKSRLVYWRYTHDLSPHHIGRILTIYPRTILAVYSRSIPAPYWRYTHDLSRTILAVHSRSIPAPDFTCISLVVRQLIVIKIKDRDNFRTLAILLFQVLYLL
jgi:hypothetical protein